MGDIHITCSAPFRNWDTRFGVPDSAALYPQRQQGASQQRPLLALRVTMLQDPARLQVEEALYPATHTTKKGRARYPNHGKPLIGHATVRAENDADGTFVADPLLFDLGGAR
jgi:hypothetical protein